MDLSPQFSGHLVGISNTIATVPGIIGNVVTGAILSGHDKDWGLVFSLAAAIYIVGAVSFVAFASGEREGASMACDQWLPVSLYRFVAGGYDLYMPVHAPASSSNSAPGLLSSVLLSLARSPSFCCVLMRVNVVAVPVAQLSSTTYQQQLLLRESCARTRRAIGPCAPSAW